MEGQPGGKIRVALLGPNTRIGGVGASIDLLQEHIDRSRVEFHYTGVGKFSANSPAWMRPAEYFRSARRVLRDLHTSQPDLVHINPSLNWRSLPFQLLLASLVARTGIPLLLHFRGWDGRIAGLLASRGGLAGLLRRAIHRAERIIVLSNHSRQQLLQAGFPPGKVHVVPEMIATRQFAWPEKEPPAPGCLKVLFVSRLVRKKGIFELVDSVAWWKQHVPGVRIRLEIVGDGECDPSLQEVIHRQSLTQEVVLSGRLQGEQKAAAYRNADIFAFPSYYPEGFPLVILEAMAAGLPLVYTAVGALGEVLSEQNGICLARAEVTGQGIGAALLRLHKDPARMRQVGRANRAQVQDKYDARVVCAMIASIYETMLQERG